VRLPSGTVTFLFTDLADSTRVWEREPDAMRAAVARHDVLVQDSVERHGGAVVKSTGDGVMAAFPDATHAVAAAVDAQRAVVAEPWLVPIAVRMGLHTGPAEPLAGDYHAPAVNRAARVAGAAHPGQILVSTATAATADGWRFRDLGEHHLKGLPPIGLHQVLAEGLPADFPPLAVAPASAPLPRPLTSLVGREHDVEAVCRSLRDHRVVTLTGVGGCGKTRLAIEVARRSADEVADGVRFVDLAPVADDDRAVDAVAGALGLAEPAAASPFDRLVQYLAGREVLVVLDNCEHLLDVCAELAEAVATRGGACRILATSREPLAVPGEQVWSVPSLDAATDAVRLFADRARLVRDGFVVDQANAASVAEICRRLDGIPLAIELAAAQVAHLSVDQIRERLDDRFTLLVGGRRRVQRQQTLAAALDWSHGMLADREQVVFRRLAVFPASFPLEAAHAVADTGDVLPVLAALVAKSLVVVVDAGDRFR
jgi:predicted ATPase/class 3 adenylate cyclase